jgi:glycine/D-amino acid oxidase-like deaminating enzyme
MGASAAWHLARAGASVSLIDKHSNARHGVTASSFGWVGTGASLPSENQSAFALDMQAVREYAQLQQDLGQLPVAVRGALIWRHTEEATAAFITEQQAAGVRMEGVPRAKIVEWEPRLTLTPVLAAWAPDDFAVEPADLAVQLIAAAGVMEAKVHRGSAEAIETACGRVVGVRMRGKTIPADIVVLANGYGARSLAASLGAQLPLLEAPAVLMRFSAEPRLIRHLLCGSGLEVRPTSGGGLTSVAAFPEDGENGLAAQTASAIAGLLALPTTPPLLSVMAPDRPMTREGIPLRGFVGEIGGLYALVAHPGVALAPLLGRLAASEIMSA